jgi:ATP-dependent Clp protease ATP-binding subunit ClpC
VTEDIIMQTVSKWTGVPLQRMEGRELARMLNLEKDLERMVIGQREAVSSIARALRRSRADLKDPRRPIGSFVFLGPTGVGKTMLAKAFRSLSSATRRPLSRSTCRSTWRSSMCRG